LSLSLWLSLRDGVAAVRTGDAGVAVEGHGARLLFRPDHPAIAEGLTSLVPPGRDDEQVTSAILDAAGPGALAHWYHAIERLGRRGLLCWSVHAPEGPLVTLVPVSKSSASTGRPVPLSAGQRYRLSRFAYLRREENTMVLEAPTSQARLIIHNPAAVALVASLAVSSTIPEQIERAARLSAEAVPLVLGLMAQAGMVEEWADDTATEAKPIASALDSWEFHDLLFHARTRQGRTDAPIGGTYHLAGKVDVPPPVRPIPEGVPLPLFRPDLVRLQVEDPPLSRVVEARRSVRDFGQPPINAQQLGEFLYRVARVRDEQEWDLDTPAGAIRVTTAARPYPSGGALYELEFYTAVATCAGVEAGLHYYEPRGHALVRIRGCTPEVEGLLRNAAESAGIPRDSVQVLVIVSVRVPRISWKYESIAYALVLKHVGVVYHAMYLAATAMGLAPCALGAGDSDLFARAAGTDYYAETSVGEFLLGSRPEADPAAR
jgi:oxazoline/thiazoline dehydrogenase